MVTNKIKKPCPYRRDRDSGRFIEKSGTDMRRVTKIERGGKQARVRFSPTGPGCGYSITETRLFGH